MGFGVRKHYLNRAKDNVITSRGFVCNKEGQRRKDKRDHLTKEGRAETRTGCHARMGIKFIRKTRKYCVYDFVAEHNHELHKPECVHMMRSVRKLRDVQECEVNLADDAELTQKMSHDFFSVQDGGKENLGFLRVDQNNYLRTKRQRALVYEEWGSLLRYFENQVLKYPSFFYAVQLDKEELITNIFWADARIHIDYELFGDVLTFDTTFATNKE
ncbi:FAR1 domain-containing protein [Cephalotus follicularis]|uniref:FAR1 domain-containing protein n=1 Tax=Cephalotus follicularis TaxID=3775 RepID=A0A1Q3CPK2_CEPFO|nr:FAR1 domain-containing protein [Cephalotus follicularis]